MEINGNLTKHTIIKGEERNERKRLREPRNMKEWGERAKRREKTRE